MMKKQLVLVSLLSVGALSLSACASLSAQTANDILNRESADDVNAATSNVDEGAEVPAGGRVTIKAISPWTIESVSISGTNGNQERGVPLPGKVWASTPLIPGQMSTYAATMRNATTGDIATVVKKAIAGPALNHFEVKLSPDSGTYGVGIVPEAKFSQSVPKKDRAPLTSRIEVSTQSGTPVSGAWRWVDSDRALFRPTPRGKNIFFKAKTAYVVRAAMLNAMISASDGAPLAWGDKPASTKFKTAREMIITINSDSHSADVKIDGKTVREMGVSLGKSGYTTRSGIKTLTDKHVVQRMTNEGVTSEEVYDLQVPYAMRLTDTGEFLHAAPWNGNIGYANTSHGCSNLGYDDAVWVYDHMEWGDPVITKNTGREMENWNGPGAVWNIPWSQWASTSGSLY